MAPTKALGEPDEKHAIKQVDRFLSNQGIDPWELAKQWVPYMIGERTEIAVAMDWTDFDADDQSTLMLALLTTHGRATPDRGAGLPLLHEAPDYA